MQSVPQIMSQTDIDHLDIAKKELWENRDYFRTESVEKAGKYIDALEWLIVSVPQLASHGGSQAEELRQDIRTWQILLEKAKSWLAGRRSQRHAGFRLRGMTRMRSRYQYPYPAEPSEGSV